MQDETPTWLAAGARTVTWNGCPVAASFGDPLAEWRALRRAAGVVPGLPRVLLEVTGEDRVSFLHGLLSQDLRALSAGTAVPAFALDEQGKVVAHLRVAAGEDRLWLDVPAWQAGELSAHLERYLVADEVEIHPPQESEVRLAVIGPAAGELWERATGIPPVAPGRHGCGEWEGAPVRLLGVAELRGPGFGVIVPQAAAAALLAALTRAGAQPCGLDALQAARVEDGIPWSGVDMDRGVLAMETGLFDAISFEKGCYLGQEVVERIHSRGHVNRELRGLVLDPGEPLPPPGAAIEAEGRTAGEVRSAVRSPALERPVALAYVHRRAWEPGTRVAVRTGEGSARAEVVRLPFLPAGVQQ